MSVNNYTYFGPIIKINKKSNWIIQKKICPNICCDNHEIHNNLNSFDKFCSKCGNINTYAEKYVKLDEINNIPTLIRFFKDFENFGEYIEYPEGETNLLVLTKESIGIHGLYVNSDNFNFFDMKEDFNIQEKISLFNDEIKNNGLYALLSRVLPPNSFNVVYGLMNFGDY